MALRYGASRQSVYAWKVRYERDGVKLEASVYHDVDALILTGNAHTISPSAQELLAQLGQPVDQVPRLASKMPPGDSGYVTVQDAQPPRFMYEVANADPRVVALDIATKEDQHPQGDPHHRWPWVGYAAGCSAWWR